LPTDSALGDAARPLSPATRRSYAVWVVVGASRDPYSSSGPLLHQAAVLVTNDPRQSPAYRFLTFFPPIGALALMMLRSDDHNSFGSWRDRRHSSSCFRLLLIPTCRLGSSATSSELNSLYLFPAHPLRTWVRCPQHVPGNTHDVPYANFEFSLSCKSIDHRVKECFVMSLLAWNRLLSGSSFLSTCSSFSCFSGNHLIPMPSLLASGATNAANLLTPQSNCAVVHHCRFDSMLAASSGSTQQDLHLRPRRDRARYRAGLSFLEPQTELLLFLASSWPSLSKFRSSRCRTWLPDAPRRKHPPPRVCHSGRRASQNGTYVMMRFLLAAFPAGVT